MGKFLILTGPVQSGKSTALMNFVSAKNTIDGFICPDVNGQRMMYFPNENRLMNFQIQTSEQIINIGKFSFDKGVFEKACCLIRDSVNSNSEYFIIDEVGPLELKKQGYYEALTAVINDWKKHSNKTMILVVREQLVNEVIELFSLDEVDIVSIEFFLKTPVVKNINGIILSGGNSSRMGVDKFLLKYDGTEQYKRLESAFKDCNLNCYLSCNQVQNQKTELTIEKIVDNDLFQDAGPLTGILSSYEQLNSDLLIAGCDYPYLSNEHFGLLLQFSSYGFEQIGFVKNNNSDIVEPLIVYLSKNTLKELKLFYMSGGRSLNKFLQSNNLLKVQLNNDAFLRSFDTPDDYHTYIKNN